MKDAMLNAHLERRRFHKLRGVAKYRVEIELDRRTRQSAEADTIEGAWKAACLGAQILADTTIDPRCPWDEKGSLR